MITIAVVIHIHKQHRLIEQFGICLTTPHHNMSQLYILMWCNCVDFKKVCDEIFEWGKCSALLASCAGNYVRNTYPVIERPSVCISNHSVLFFPRSATLLRVEQLNADGNKAVAKSHLSSHWYFALNAFQSAGDHISRLLLIDSSKEFMSSSN